MNRYEASIQAVAETTLGKPLGEIRREMDYLMGVADKTLSNRIEAFGAIRRAAQEARLADEDNSYTAHVAAQEIRRAIRAAIRSEKI